ncbi:hypothetical protein BABINDRAFT_164149 [Babjeviella inositovora NRRL Y-12698]|uniref:Major facilitator superfamily (MFS) profile domain-containing protein n=1 Tax=Babjeviella inositovora NRRL Y-12698 TaxID=984486 RepID=A0A1E3QXE1_9ASCO|nr:uncharacterized protein BABINDRAFT_164149 [Babjeviella inositovora NRRL Y-12698]ODQ82340.1 hypothetical protein BABINDRAFT_164149 [Babjeviella inositovora NRRL Y-12698]
MAKQKLTLKQQMEGFPTEQVVVVGLIRFAEPIAFTSLFPYVYFLVRDSGIAKDDGEISKYSGYLSASFAFFQFLVSIHWGRAADIVGRKKVLLMGLFGTSISLLMFGFSKSFYMALFSRSLMGALNGNIGVLRTVLGEIAVERKHQAIAFSTLPLLWNVGSVIGPLIGGFLTFTSSDNPVKVAAITSLDDFFRHKYPYALANIVVAGFLWFSMVVGFLFLEETQCLMKDKPDIGLILGDRLKRLFGVTPKTRPWDSKRIPRYDSQVFDFVDDAIDSCEENSGELSPLLIEDNEAPSLLYTGLEPSSTAACRLSAASLDPSLSSEESLKSPSIHSFGILSRRQSLALVRTYSMNQPDEVETTADNWREAFPPGVVKAISVNFILSLHTLVFDEFLPVFLALDADTENCRFPLRIVGGLSFDTITIGTLVSATGFMGILIILFIFPYLDRNYEMLPTLRALMLVMSVVYFFVPLSVFTVLPQFPKWFPIVALYTLTSLKALGNANCFPQVMLLIHRASPFQHRALINGASMSISSLARTIGPLVWGNIMSFSENNQVGWLTWWSLSLLSLLGTVQTFTIQDENEDEVGETAAETA